MKAFETFIHARITEEASTRAVALFRIVLASLIIQRFSKDMSFYQLGDPTMYLMGGTFFLLTSLMLVGALTRVAVPAVAVWLGVIYYGDLIGLAYESGRSHHQYVLLICTVLLSFAPSGRSLSVDRFLAVRAAERTGAPLPAESGTRWAQDLIVFQLCAIYLWTAIDKTHWEFVAGDRLERIFEWVYATHPLYELLTWKPMLAFGSSLILVVEYILPVAILARWRLHIIVPMGLALHALFYVALPVFTYSATMMAIYILVLDSAAVHRAMDSLLGREPHAA